MKTKDMFMETREQGELVPVIRKKSIYNIQSDHLLLMQMIEDLEGEITPEISEQLAINKADLEEKAVSYGYVMRQYDFEVDQINQEITRLTKIAASKSKIKEELKSRISESMLYFNVDKIEMNNLKLSFRQSESLIIDEGAHIPVEYITTVETEKIDKAEIKKDVKAGKEMLGIWIQKKQNLQIR